MRTYNSDNNEKGCGIFFLIIFVICATILCISFEKDNNEILRKQELAKSEQIIREHDALLIKLQHQKILDWQKQHHGMIYGHLYKKIIDKQMTYSISGSELGNLKINGFSGHLNGTGIGSVDGNGHSEGSLNGGAIYYLIADDGCCIVVNAATYYSFKINNIFHAEPSRWLKPEVQ